MPFWPSHAHSLTLLHTHTHTQCPLQADTQKQTLVVVLRHSHTFPTMHKGLCTLLFTPAADAEELQLSHSCTCEDKHTHTLLHCKSFHSQKSSCSPAADWTSASHFLDFLGEESSRSSPGLIFSAKRCSCEDLKTYLIHVHLSKSLFS